MASSIIQRLGLDVSDFERGLKGAQAKAQGFGANFSRVLGAIGVSVGFGSIVQGFNSLRTEVDALAKSAQRLGITVESFQVLGFAAGQSGAKVEELERALADLNKRISLAAAGNPAAAKTFADLGISLRDSSGNLRSADAVLADIADRIASAGSGAARTGIAFSTMGEAGQRLVPMLAGGSAALVAFREEAERLGIVISGQTAKDIEQLNDRIAILERRLRTAGVSGVGAVIDLGKALRGLADENPRLEKLLKTIFPLARVFDNKDLFGGFESAEQAAERLRELNAELQGIVDSPAPATLRDIGAEIAGIFRGAFDRVVDDASSLESQLGRVNDKLREAVVISNDQSKTDAERLAAANEAARLIQRQAQLEKQIHTERKRENDKEKDRREQERKAQEQRRKDEADRIRSLAAASDMFRDVTRVSLGELAGAGRGSGLTSQARQGARRVQSLERRATEARSRGNDTLADQLQGQA